jgi:3-hydroxybutyryl-CoA dehydrogenase
MGAGIAQVAVQHGHGVVLCDVDRAAAEQGRERVREGLRRRAAKLELDAASRERWVDGRLDRIRTVDGAEALAGASDVVIEAAVEDLERKQELFRRLDAAAREDVPLATNTSALSVSAIAAATAHPGRVLGLHFFNPVPVMRLVEVVGGDHTEPGVLDAAERLVRAWGKVAVRCADAPGFIVNRVNRPYTIEALRILEDGQAGVEAIDAAMRDGGFPMGPFELMDLAGLDVNLAAARGVWAGLGRPERLRPSPVQDRLVLIGRLGRKSGSGFYRYGEGERQVEADFADDAPLLRPEAIRARILAAVAAEAVRARDEGVATEADIDRALRLGAAHPTGPFEGAREVEAGR